MAVSSKANAFLIRSLRQESRLFSHHMLRGGLAATIFGLICFGLFTYANRGSTGGGIVTKVMTSCYWFVTLLGGIYFSTAIVEEKEEQTLPLLRMTGASPFAILIGKSIPRLMCVLLMLLVILPFVFLAVTLGGVDLRGVTIAMLGILIFAVMLSQIGLFASVVSRDAQRAFSKTLFIFSAFEFLPSWSWLASSAALAWTGLKTTEDAQAYLANGVSDGLLMDLGAWTHVKLQTVMSWATDKVLFGNLTDYLGGFISIDIWTPQMSTHLILALVFFLLSWLLFEPFTSRVVAEGNIISQSSNRKTRSRVWDRALIWKAWKHQGGGLWWNLIRLVGFPALVAGIVSVVLAATGERFYLEAIAIGLLVCGTVVTIAHVAILFGRLFNSEVKEKTLSSLMLLPIGRHSFVAQTILGLIPAVVTSGSAIAIGIGLLIWNASRRTSQIDLGFLEEIWFYQIIALGITAIIVGVRLSIRLTYGGMLLSVVVFCICGPICAAMLAETIRTVWGWQAVNTVMDYYLPRVLFALEIPVWIICEIGIVRSLERAAERA